MNFSKQLKKYRELNGYSQEILAKKIYVTRQTISKWENDKTYPDIHNLIALSVLFDISLDELIKGDVEVMKDVVSQNNLKFWTWNLLVTVVLVPLSMGPVFRMWEFKGLIITFLLMIWLAVSAFKLEKFKKNNNLRTYSEIISFLEKKKIPNEKIIDKELKQIHDLTPLVVMVTVILAIILLGIGFILF